MTSSAASAQLAPTREEIERRQPRTPAPPTQLQVEGDIERTPCALDEPQFADVKFTLRTVEFGGLRGVDPSILQSAYAEEVGRENPVSAVCRIRDKAAALLRQAGYIAAVQVPEQSISEGNLRYDVVLAKLVDIRVLGDAGRSERLIAKYLNRLREHEVFNRFEAERYLLLASELPGYNVRLALRPAGTVPGEVVGEVTVLRTAFAIDASIENLGSKDLGRGGAQVRAQLYGLTGLGDVTTAGLFITQDFTEQKDLQLSHEFRVGTQGLNFGASMNYSWARPDFDGPLEIKAETLFASFWAGYPFLRRQATRLNGMVGLDIVNQDVDQNGEDFTRDRLRVAFARLLFDSYSMDFRRPGYSQIEPVWRIGGNAEIRQGLDIFGATESCDRACRIDPGVTPSRPDADPTATVVRALLYGEYRPVPKLTFALGLRGQYASESILSFEEFAGGNYTAGRGYDPGAILGDSGYGIQAEMRLGSVIPKSARSLAAQPYLFLDYARVWNETDFFLPPGQRDLFSTGGGIRASFRGFSLDTVVAFPLERSGFANDKPSPRLLFSLTRRLWPWGP
ncbi:ShlB/FhaC/HecB family hemolysin secretion/activation protein [Sphingomonas sp. HDW15A]|uniref:ShlB/FhaC/HecB family hemolysin secretion/activation protein n=1 Tax=Sphingomonas sp. HDW15A TaxID=2714942 RepID=UPI001F0E8B1C|nr:ShlB/FhaC/HecB family hemolysin secretion/activation protein [Sphingomonas sp. HDW15A]